MKIIFFGTSDVALPILEALRTQHDIVSVVTAPDAKVGRKQILTPSPVAQLASELGLPTLKPDKVKNNAEFLNQLRALSADIFIVVSYGKILPLDLLNIPPLKTLNVHFSLLPKYRGAAPIQFALLNGETSTGTTIFILDELLDHGSILAQESAAIEPDDTFLTLSQRLAHQSAKLLLKILPDYSSGKLTPQEQDHSQATSTKIISKDDGRVDWTKTAAEIYNQFRALYPWPGIWTTWDGKILKILDCLPAQAASDAAPGTVLTGGVVACGGRTSLQIKSLQLEGKNPTPINEFINGYKNFIGSKLKPLP